MSNVPASVLVAWPPTTLDWYACDQAARQYGQPVLTMQGLLTLYSMRCSKPGHYFTAMVHSRALECSDVLEHCVKAAQSVGHAQVTLYGTSLLGCSCGPVFPDPIAAEAGVRVGFHYAASPDHAGASCDLVHSYAGVHADYKALLRRPAGLRLLSRALQDWRTRTANRNMRGVLLLDCRFHVYVNASGAAGLVLAYTDWDRFGGAGCFGSVVEAVNTDILRSAPAEDALETLEFARSLTQRDSYKFTAAADLFPDEYYAAQTIGGGAGLSAKMRQNSKLRPPLTGAPAETAQADLSESKELVDAAPVGAALADSSPQADLSGSPELPELPSTAGPAAPPDDDFDALLVAEMAEQSVRSDTARELQQERDRLEREIHALTRRLEDQRSELEQSSTRQREEYLAELERARQREEAFTVHIQAVEREMARKNEELQRLLESTQATSRDSEERITRLLTEMEQLRAPPVIIDVDMVRPPKRTADKAYEQPPPSQRRRVAERTDRRVVDLVRIEKQKKFLDNAPSANGGPVVDNFNEVKTLLLNTAHTPTNIWNAFVQKCRAETGTNTLKRFNQSWGVIDTYRRWVENVTTNAGTAKGVLLGDQPGLGKTGQSATLALRYVNWLKDVNLPGVQAYTAAAAASPATRYHVFAVPKSIVEQVSQEICDFAETGVKFGLVTILSSDQHRNMAAVRCSDLEFTEEQKAEGFKDMIIVTTHDSCSLSSDFVHYMSLSKLERTKMLCKEMTDVAESVSKQTADFSVTFVNVYLEKAIRRAAAQFEGGADTLRELCTSTLTDMLTHAEMLQDPSSSELVFIHLDGKKELDVLLEAYSMFKAGPLVTTVRQNLCTLIVDEAHKLRSTDSMRFQDICCFADSAQSTLIMTGTPIYGAVDDIVAMAYLVGLKWLPQYQESAANGGNKVDLERVKAELVGKLRHMYNGMAGSYTRGRSGGGGVWSWDQIVAPDANDAAGRAKLFSGSSVGSQADGAPHRAPEPKTIVDYKKCRDNLYEMIYCTGMSRTLQEASGMFVEKVMSRRLTLLNWSNAVNSIVKTLVSGTPLNAQQLAAKKALNAVIIRRTCVLQKRHLYSVELPMTHNQVTQLIKSMESSAGGGKDSTESHNLLQAMMDVEMLQDNESPRIRWLQSFLMGTDPIAGRPTDGTFKYTVLFNSRTELPSHYDEPLEQYLREHGKTLQVSRVNGSSPAAINVKTFKEAGEKDKHVSLMIVSSSAKEGLNLQFCNHLIMDVREFTLSDELQIIGRIHRTGQTNECHIYFLKSVARDGSGKPLPSHSDVCEALSQVKTYRASKVLTADFYSDEIAQQYIANIGKIMSSKQSSVQQASDDQLRLMAMNYVRGLKASYQRYQASVKGRPSADLQLPAAKKITTTTTTAANDVVSGILGAAQLSATKLSDGVAAAGNGGARRAAKAGVVKMVRDLPT